MPSPTAEPAEAADRRPADDLWHLASRFSGGYTRSLHREILDAGGPLDWFDAQLDASRVVEGGPDVESWFPLLSLPPRELWRRSEQGRLSPPRVARELGAYTVMKRIHSRRAVLERMVELWSDHLHVFALEGDGWMYRPDYDRVLRRHALGRFDDLLVEASLHPAMLTYLDTDKSTAAQPNENHGRELLELHTVGIASGYTDDDVKGASRILSGWTVARYGDWQRTFDARRHSSDSVKVLGFRSDGRGRSGDESRRLLRYLARHPATARTIATRLARRFISDEPSAATIAELARVYLQHDTAIRPVLRALVRTEEFWESAGLKTRDPVTDLVATARVLDVRFSRPRSDEDAAYAVLNLHGGYPPFMWRAPDGHPDDGQSHGSPSRLITSFKMHWQLASGALTAPGVRFRPVSAWIAKEPEPFDSYVDRLSRHLHGRNADERVLEACCIATGHRPDDLVDRTSPLAGDLGVRALAVLLDHPRHLAP